MRDAVEDGGGGEGGWYGYKRATGGNFVVMEMSCASTVSMLISWL